MQISFPFFLPLKQSQTESIIEKDEFPIEKNSSNDSTANDSTNKINSICLSHHSDSSTYPKNIYRDFISGTDSCFSGMGFFYPTFTNKGPKRIYKKKSEEKIKRWTKEESKLYEQFVQENRAIFNDPNSKRITKVFIFMSNFIKTKTASQCRSHHQKFYKKIEQKSDSNIDQIQNVVKNDSPIFPLESLVNSKIMDELLNSNKKKEYPDNMMLHYNEFSHDFNFFKEEINFHEESFLLEQDKDLNLNSSNFKSEFLEDKNNLLSKDFEMNDILENNEYNSDDDIAKYLMSDKDIENKNY